MGIKYTQYLTPKYHSLSFTRLELQDKNPIFFVNRVLAEMIRIPKSDFLFHSICADIRNFHCQLGTKSKADHLDSDATRRL
jgi:hypothetical protein